MDLDSPSLERAVADLEGRVRALEQTVASLGDTRQLEQRVAERVSAQVPRVSVESVVEAISAKPLPPAVKTMLGASSDKFTGAKAILSFGKQLDRIKARENDRS